METMMNKLDRSMKLRFPGAQTELDPFEPPSRVGGLVIWDGFEGMGMELRVKKVYEAMKKDLKPAELKRVAIIIPLTPEEMIIRRDEIARDQEEGKRTVLGS